MVVNITDDVEAGLIPIKHMLALYVGGMGAKDHNFHKELVSRMGFEADAEKIQELYLAGKKQEAAEAVPSALAMKFPSRAGRKDPRTFASMG